jgi:hypothetical protein
MDKTPVMLFLLLALSPLPCVTLQKMRWAMKLRQEYALNQNWSAEYSTGMFGILMGGVLGLSVTPYLIYAYFVLFR